jgi:hypothetical protein
VAEHGEAMMFVSVDDPIEGVFERIRGVPDVIIEARLVVLRGVS